MLVSSLNQDGPSDLHVSILAGSVRVHFVPTARTVPELSGAIWILPNNLQDWHDRLDDEMWPSFDESYLKDTLAALSSTLHRSRQSL